MYCRQCGLLLPVETSPCSRCGNASHITEAPTAIMGKAVVVDLSTKPITPVTIPHTQQVVKPSASSSKARFWIVMGIILFLLSGGVIGGTFWWVKQRRASAKLSPTTPLTPLTPNTVNGTGNLDLNRLKREELVNLLPVYLLEKIRSEMGDKQPDDLRVITEEDAQYLVVLSTSPRDDDEAKDLLLSVFKLDGNHLADVTREAVPAYFPAARIGDQFSEISFRGNGRDITIANPIAPDDRGLIGSCSDCEQAYTTQDINWQQGEYVLGSAGWHNDAYTACYVVARALEKKRIMEKDRPFIATNLDGEITLGFERGVEQWELEKLSRDILESMDEDHVPLNAGLPETNENSLFYRLSNGLNTIILTVSKNGEQWQVVALKRE